MGVVRLVQLRVQGGLLARLHEASVDCFGRGGELRVFFVVLERNLAQSVRRDRVLHVRVGRVFFILVQLQRGYALEVVSLLSAESTSISWVGVYPGKNGNAAAISILF